MAVITACPVCSENTLSTHELETNLQASKCSKCAGVWVGAAQYEYWLQRHGENLPEKAADRGVSLLSGETSGARFCPECKYVLMKYKVGHQTGFSLNRCAHCAGVWFDKNEWDILKSRNLHDDVQLVFSQPWQTAVRAEEHKAAMEDLFRDELGEADLKEIKRIKEWLQQHPKSAELYAYLLSDMDDRKKAASGSVRAGRPRSAP